MMQTLILLLTILFALVCHSTSNIEEECVYEGNMCGIHPQRCLDEFWRQCYSMSYPALYATKADVELWVNITDFTTYPTDLTMAVVRVSNGTLTALDNCCNLRINESCTLPGFSDNFHYELFAPTRRRKQPYCSRRIAARPAIHPKWCKLNASKPCLVLKDGIVGVDDVYKQISTVGWPVRHPTDYCFFNAPKAYGRRGNFVSDGLAVQVEGIDLENTTVRGEDFQTTCTVLERGRDFNLLYALQSYNAPAGFTRCVFIRIKRYDINWIMKSICIPGPKSNWSTVVIAVVASVVFLALVIVSVLVCKKYLKSFFPSYKTSVGEGIQPRIQALKGDAKYFTSLDKNSMTPTKKLNEDSDNSREEHVRYVTSFSNSNLSSSEGLENFYAIVPEQEPQLHDKDSSEVDTNDENSTMKLNYRIGNDYRVSSAKTALPPTDGYTHKEHPNLMPNVRMEKAQAASKTNEDDKITCSSTMDLNDNNTDNISLFSESIEKNISTLNAGNTFDYVTKSSLLLHSIPQHNCITSPEEECSRVETSA